MSPDTRERPRGVLEGSFGMLRMVLPLNCLPSSAQLLPPDGQPMFTLLGPAN